LGRIDRAAPRAWFDHEGLQAGAQRPFDRLREVSRLLRGGLLRAANLNVGRLSQRGRLDFLLGADRHVDQREAPANRHAMGPRVRSQPGAEGQIQEEPGPGLARPLARTQGGAVALSLTQVISPELENASLLKRGPMLLAYRSIQLRPIVSRTKVMAIRRPPRR
jgi:hypothetical protein